MYIYMYISHTSLITTLAFFLENEQKTTNLGKKQMLDPLQSAFGAFLTSISNIARGNIHHKMLKSTLWKHMFWKTLSSIQRQKTENCLFGFFYTVINFRYQRAADRGNVAKAQHFTKNNKRKHPKV